MKKKVLLIDKQAFCDWYFDNEICEEFFYRHNMLQSLENHGFFKITLDDLLKKVGYLPEYVAKEGQNPILYDNDKGNIDMNFYDIIKFAK